ncbi:trehalose synthase [Longibacter salinarum]|uniref:Maltokinase n=1 Tax=Longibacter salinarum TaxID=1850348 RepID=A0A2A8D174_9BACT|nr:alpha-amylase family glycosyl hydrolase [Longibacter salinarum]PEN14641.1 trehalose synthase [Longibacter salinarum]
MSDSFLTDPLWYKDAVIYELHVRSFYDSNNDGYGDFQGMREKLPYLESLGVNTLWLLPFLESPLKDDGYDTADYFKVLPVHGDLDDFQAFLDEAHARGMRVITELVLNHTSDQHPWFQEARDPSSDKHDWYVWNETDDKYEDVRIIFTDTEVSNWTWDQKAQKYYWHRFFSHQPDLNYDNPKVREKMKEVMFFWLDMGVDGLRLDAVPYLFEREGTNSENLPETIDYIKYLRAAVEERYGPGKVLLAEANQWPEDTLPYFGGDENEQDVDPSGDGSLETSTSSNGQSGNTSSSRSTGVQMAFNFPIMPRMFMALRRENRRPLVEMMELTKDIPDDAQWAIFLRNHDELTLEMVTDEERDYMYHEYAADGRFRINVGIRRRLAPLLGGERRRIELMKALLFSLDGSPVIYYGDEIGMGDDPFLGDRNGVRTPMQWRPDKNGGFSRAEHPRLFLPPINRGRYSYEVVNVEDAMNDPHSLLHFTRRLITMRQQHKEVFGRGTLDLIPVDNTSVLTFVREYEGEKILVVANLSRYAQAINLPSDHDLGGLAPVELFSQAPFPAIQSEEAYPLTIGPHGFYWFKLEPEEEIDRAEKTERVLQLAERGPDGSPLPVLTVAEGLQNLLVPTMAQYTGPEALARILPDFVADQRWFGSKGRPIDSVTVEDAVRLSSDPTIYLSIISVEQEGSNDLYTLPLATASGPEAEELLSERPESALAWIDVQESHRGDARRQLVYDATAQPAFWSTLYRWWQNGGRNRSLKGLYIADSSTDAPSADASKVQLLTGEQSNTSAVIDGAHFVKLYRRLERGTNPEKELLNHLTGTGFRFAPHLHGTIDVKRNYRRYTIGIVQEALPVETDGWSHALQATRRFLDRVKDAPLPAEADEAEEALQYGPTQGIAAPVWLEDVASEMIQLAHVLGVRTAEMHRALAKGSGPDLSPLPADESAGTKLQERVRAELGDTREMIENASTRSDSSITQADVPSEAAWERAIARLDALVGTGADHDRIRIHGDYHLGQVLRADGDFYILDFEGEPVRSLSERRQRENALRDVAGMLRSIEYAVLAAWQDHTGTDTDYAGWVDALVRWADITFLNAYGGTADEASFLQPPETRYDFLWAYLFDKAIYEVRYELNHRPSWAWLPLRGLRRLLDDREIVPPEPVE